MSPFFSVVIPLFNKPLSLPRCVASVMSAIGDRNVEVIIVDDGSTDGSSEIADKLASSDGRIFVLKKANGGVSSARNAGIALAKGSHVLLLDADDRWSDNHLDVIQELINAYPDASLYATNYACHSEDGSFSPKMVGIPEIGTSGYINSLFLSFAYGAMPVSSSSVCIPKNTWNSVGGFRVDVGHGEDRIFWADASLRGPIVMANTVTAHYHLDAENRSFSSWTPAKGRTFRDRLLEVEESLLTSPNWFVDIDHLRECIMSETYKLGKNCGSLGFKKEALQFRDALATFGYQDAALEVLEFVDQVGIRPTFDFPSPRRSEFMKELSMDKDRILRSPAL